MQLQGTLLSPALTRQLLRRVLDVAERHAANAREALRDQAAGVVRHVAAAGLLRLPGLLRAVEMLLEAGLVLESEPLIRVLVELAIVAMWTGTEEERARKVRRNSVLQMRRTFERIGRTELNLGPEYKELVEEVQRQAAEASPLPPIAELAREADLPSWARLEPDTLESLGQLL